MNDDLAGIWAHIRVALVVTGLVVLNGCGHGSKRSTDEVTTPLLRRGLSGEPSSLDPGIAGDNFSQQLLTDLYEGLTTESPTGEALPGVADSWVVDQTGTQYTFHLRANAQWSNGKPVRAQDFVIAWRRVVDPAQGSQVADDLRLIAGASDIIAGKASPDTLKVSAPNDDTLVVRLEYPAPYLPLVLTHSAAFPVYSEASARTHSPDAWISNGPYVLTSWQIGTNAELSINPHYWDQASVHIPRVEYQFTSDENSQYARYRANQLDLTDSVPVSAIAPLLQSHSKELIFAPVLATVYYELNMTLGPTARSKKLREALSLAIDRRRLVSTLGLGQVPAYGFVPPGVWNYAYQSQPWKVLSDADRNALARQLYAEAGYSTQRPLNLRLLYSSSVGIKQTAILIAAMWKEVLGVDTTFTEEEFRVFLQSSHDRTRWDVVRLAWTADYNDASNFLDTFRSKSINNDSGYRNDAFDSLLDQASRTVDATRRRDSLEKAERTVLSDYPTIPLFHLVSKHMAKPYVIGVRPSPLNRVPSKALTLQPH
jgi:oligopeptide transport system substrate-binding protein